MAARRNTCSTRDPGQPQVARGLQVDPVERGGQVVRQVARREVAERLRPGHRRACRTRPNSATASPQFLHRGRARSAPADLGDQRADPAGRRGPGAGRPARRPAAARRMVSSADTGSAGGSSASPSVRSSSRISGAVHRRESFPIRPARPARPEVSAGVASGHALELTAAVRRGWRGAGPVRYRRRRWPGRTETAGPAATAGICTGAGSARSGCSATPAGGRAPAAQRPGAAAAAQPVGSARRHLGAAGRRQGQR